MKVFVTASLRLSASLIAASCSPSQDENTSPDLSDDPTAAVAAVAKGTGVHVNAVTEAPTGFDALTNGTSIQADMDAAADVFSELESAPEGVGPVYMAASCTGCHDCTPAAPAQPAYCSTAGPIEMLYYGNFNGVNFVDPPGGSLIHDRANDRSIEEHILPGNNVQVLRSTNNIAGDGFVEAIDSNTLTAIAAAQPAAQRGTVIQVPVVEAGGTLRVGRFGWKNQNSSILSYAAESYVSEIGITNRLFPMESTSNGTVVQGGPFDGKADPEDDANDIDQFALFLRSLKAPPRGPINTSVTNGQTQFNNIGCAICHVATITTAPAGTVINGGAFTVPAALGDKNIHPFSDYLLHDVGTGDGIVQNGGQSTRNQLRTAPLWGIGARTRFMHDGASLTVGHAIQRHANQAATAKNNFNALSAADQSNVVAFIFSL
jgi:CxxC motif-containing protein (DUF1111 family)